MCESRVVALLVKFSGAPAWCGTTDAVCRTRRSRHVHQDVGPPSLHAHHHSGGKPPATALTAHRSPRESCFASVPRACAPLCPGRLRACAALLVRAPPAIDRECRRSRGQLGRHPRVCRFANATTMAPSDCKGPVAYCRLGLNLSAAHHAATLVTGRSLGPPASPRPWHLPPSPPRARFAGNPRPDSHGSMRESHTMHAPRLTRAPSCSVLPLPAPLCRPAAVSCPFAPCAALDAARQPPGACRTRWLSWVWATWAGTWQKTWSRRATRSPYLTVSAARQARRGIRWPATACRTYTNQRQRLDSKAPGAPPPVTAAAAVPPRR